MKKYLALVVPLFAVGVVAACSPSGSSNVTTTTATSTAAAPARGAHDGELSEGMAKKEFEARCATCHGSGGKGDGPGSVSLSPKPRNYTDKEWQKSVTDEQIKKTILLGGAAVGKSPNMPAAPDLENKPRVVEALVKHVRKFGQ